MMYITYNDRKKELVFKYLDSVFCGITKFFLNPITLCGIVKNAVVLRVFTDTKMISLDTNILKILDVTFNLSRDESVEIMKTYLLVNKFIDSLEKYEIFFSYEEI